MSIAPDALRKWAVLALVLLTAGSARAALARFHYVAADDCGHMTLVPCGNATGEKITLFGREPYTCPLHPTCYVTFQHPCSGRMVVVPVTLPASTPQIRHGVNRYIYDYGSYTVTVVFLDDGSVDVVYNSGLLRDVCVQGG